MVAGLDGLDQNQVRRRRVLARFAAIPFDVRWLCAEVQAGIERADFIRERAFSVVRPIADGVPVNIESNDLRERLPFDGPSLRLCAAFGFHHAAQSATSGSPAHPVRMNDGRWPAAWTMRG